MTWTFKNRTVRTIRSTLLASGAALVLSTGLAAAAPATAQADLNVRSGPGARYPVVASIQAGEAVDVGSCTGSWCQVTFSGGSGFANRSYLAMAGGAPSVGVAIAPDYAPGYAPDYAPGYAYDDYPNYANDGSYDYGYDYGPGVFVGGRFHHRHDRDGREGNGNRVGTWQGRSGLGGTTWQGRPGFGGGRVGNAAPGSVMPMSGGRPTMSAPSGLRGGGMPSGGGAARVGGGGGGGGAHIGGGAGGAGHRGP